MLNKENIELTDVIENAAENAAKYYKLREKYLAWQEWYAEQKKLQEQVLK
jgi:thiamine monophosphate synthase